jgi:hypothetical protein
MKKNLLSVLALLAFAGSGMAQTLPSYVPANGLVGWWPFNGNANDESGNNNNGTVNGATLTVDRFGNANTAYSFLNSQKQFIEFDTILNLPTSNYSISGWYKVSGYNSGSITFWGTPNNNANNEIRLYGEICGSTNNAGIGAGWWSPNQVTFCNSEVGNSDWHFVTTTYDGNSIKLFFDEQLVGTLSPNNTPNFFSGNFSIGGQPWATGSTNGFFDYYFNGSLDDIAIYNRALSQTEITQLYTGQVATANCPTFPASLAQGLVGYWPFCGNALDESGNNNHGTVNGATLTTDRFGNTGSAFNFEEGPIQLTNPFISAGDSNFTISAWFNRLTSNSDDRIFSIERQFAPDGFQFRAAFDGPGTNIVNTPDFANRLYFHSATPNSNLVWGVAGPGTGPILMTSSSPSLNTWHNFIVKKRRLVYEIYLDGIFVAKDSLNNGNITSSNSPNPLLIGAVYDSPGQNLTSKFSGILDDIAIWNRALTPQEIKQVYNQGICQTSITVTDTLLIHTGITAYNPVAYGNTLKVWPNPGNTAITLDAGNLSSMQGWKYKVANTLGQTVINETAINQQQTNISLSTWGGNGIYYLHLINPQGHAIEIKKIVLAP